MKYLPKKYIVFGNYVLVNKCFKYIQIVRKCGPKMTTWRGVIWPRDSLMPGGRGKEGQGLKYPSVRLSMI
jgi:hypothetical protein